MEDDIIQAKEVKSITETKSKERKVTEVNKEDFENKLNVRMKDEKKSEYITIRNKKKETLEEISLIEDSDINIFETVNTKFQADEESKNILVEDLIMDSYNITFTDKADDSINKIYTIIVAPAVIPDNNEVFIPTFSLAKVNRNICTCTSPNRKRPSYQILLDNEIFIVRGRWDQDGFSSLLYPQNTNDKSIKIQKRQIKSSSTKNIGHNVVELENGLKIHILPMSSKNSGTGNVGILVCLEDPIEEFYMSACSQDKPYLDVGYKGITYRISATWVGKNLISEIQKT